MLTKILFVISVILIAFHIYIDYNYFNILTLGTILCLNTWVFYLEYRRNRDEITYKAFHQIERILLTSKDPNDMFQKLCETIIDDAGFKMCWVGFADDEIIKPAFYFGIGTSYAKTILISTNKQKDESKGITAKAMLSNKIQVWQNINKSEMAKPWKGKAKKYGWKSSLAIPIRRNGTAIGSFTVYSDKVGAFSEKTIDVFSELANSIDLYFQNYDTSKLFEKLFELNPNAITISDQSNNIININKKFTEITGYDKEDVIGNNPKMFKSGRHDPLFYKELWKTLKKDGHWNGEIYNKAKNGEIFLENISIFTITDNKNNIVNYISMFNDITVLKEHDAKIKFLAFHDNLTTLYNRLYIENHFDTIVKRASEQNEILIMLFIDIDKFKHINDSIGYAIGDEILKQFAKRLLSSIKRTDIIGRLGNDEFIILCVIKNLENINTVCERLIENVTNSYCIHDIDNINLSVSIGVSIYDVNGRSFEQLLKFSDIAMSRSKLLGRNNFTIYNSECVDKNIQKKFEIELNIVQAIKKKELRIVYQPLLHINSKKIVGIEALIRWDSKKLGPVPPDEFIPVVEDIEYIYEIGEFVFKRVFSELKEFHYYISDLRVSINISLQQFKHKNFVDDLIISMKDHGIDPTFICLEITEWVASHDFETTKISIAKLTELGIKIAIDDFGTGYSNLSYLHKWGINKIKIDKSFVQHISDKYESKIICQSIIDLSKNLKVETVAEGIETKEQLEIITSMGCDIAQGYFISKPLNKKALIDFFNTLI